MLLFGVVFRVVELLGLDFFLLNGIVIGRGAPGNIGNLWHSGAINELRLQLYFQADGALTHYATSV